MSNSKLLRISSHDNVIGNSYTDFRVQLQNLDYVKKVTSIGLVSVSFTNSSYNIESDNNTFTFQVQSIGLNASISIQSGQYDINSFMLALETALQTYHDTNTTGETVTISQDSITKKITITTAPGSDLTQYYNIDTNPMATVLGFKNDSVGFVASHTGSDLPDLLGLQCISIHSLALGGNNGYDAEGQIVNMLQNIHVNVPFGGNQVWYSQDQELDQNIFDQPANITAIDIRLRNPLKGGKIVELNGHQIVLIFRYFFEQ